MCVGVAPYGQKIFLLVEKYAGSKEPKEFEEADEAADLLELAEDIRIHSIILADSFFARIIFLSCLSVCSSTF